MKFEQRSGHRGRDHRHLPAERIRSCRTGAAIRHVHEIGRRGQRFQELAGEVVQRADAGMAIGQLARIGLSIVDELRERARRQRRMDGERERRHHHVADRFELLERIVERSILEDRLGDVRARSAQEDRVAIGTGAGDRAGTERTAAAALVFHHDGAEQALHLLRPGTTDRVVAAAGRKRNRQPDWTIGIFGLRNGAIR